MKKLNLLGCTALGAIAAMAMSSTAHAQLQDEVIVTATKRSETAQDVPIAVAALGESTLEELRVDVFTDYLVQLPGVTAGGAGPGNNTIYIRGLASTTPATSNRWSSSTATSPNWPRCRSSRTGISWCSTWRRRAPWSRATPSRSSASSPKHSARRSRPWPCATG